MLCRSANSRYETEREVARKYGDWNGIVNARAARRHILKLPKAGVGYKSVADAASVAHSVVAEIRVVRKLRIRQTAERSILAVTKTAYAGGAHRSTLILTAADEHSQCTQPPAGASSGRKDNYALHMRQKMR